MMRKCFKNKNGQALVEMAVLGSIILIIVAIMLSYGQMFNAQQEMNMYAFRKALRSAYYRWQDGKFGQVTFMASKDIIPVNLFTSKADKTQVSGSASVLWDAEQNFYDRDPEDENPDKGDFGTTYYQIGETMIENEEAIEMPVMRVKRRPSPYSPSNWLDSVCAIIFGFFSDDDEPYYAWEAAPIDEVAKEAQSIYDATQAKSQAGSALSYHELSTTQDISNLTYTMQTDEQIKEFDEDILDVLEKPGNVTVRQDQTITRDVTWTTPTK